MTSPDVLIPERLTGSLVVPALAQAATGVAQLAYGALRHEILRELFDTPGDTP